MSTILKEFDQETLAFIEKAIIEQLRVTSAKQSPAVLKCGYFTKKQACKYLGGSLSALNKYLKDGLIKKHCIGGRILIRQCDMDGAIKIKN